MNSPTNSQGAQLPVLSMECVNVFKARSKAGARHAGKRLAVTTGGLDQPLRSGLRHFQARKSGKVTERLAILLERNRVDRMERDPRVGFQETDQVDGGLFEAQAHASVRMLLPQLEQPFPKRLGRGVKDVTTLRRWPVRESMRQRSAF